MEGWIKLHRKLLKWEWIEEPLTTMVFIHLLLRASHNDIKWKGIELKKGQLPFGFRKFSTDTKISIRSIRTAIKKLISTHEVTHETSSKGSIITIVNWDMYQLSDTQNDTRATHERHTNDTQTTLTKNVKNVKNVKNENKYISPEQKIVPNRSNKKEVVFDFTKCEFINITQELYDTLQSKYPAIRVETEICKMEAWLLANPKNRKKNYLRFITNWLTKAQDKARRVY